MSKLSLQAYVRSAGHRLEHGLYTDAMKLSGATARTVPRLLYATLSLMLTGCVTDTPALRDTGVRSGWIATVAGDVQFQRDQTGSLGLVVERARTIYAISGINDAQVYQQTGMDQNNRSDLIMQVRTGACDAQPFLVSVPRRGKPSWQWIGACNSTFRSAGADRNRNSLFVEQSQYGETWWRVSGIGYTAERIPAPPPPPPTPPPRIVTGKPVAGQSGIARPVSSTGAAKSKAPATGVKRPTPSAPVIPIPSAPKRAAGTKGQRL